MNYTGIINYSEVIERCKKLGKFRVAVAAAQDADLLKAVKMAEEMDLADAVLVGNKSEIAPILDTLGLKNAVIIHEDNEINAAKTAVRIVEEHQADILMKGFLNSSDFLRAVVSCGETKSDILLSHLAAFEIPGQEKLIFLTDSGMIISPDLAQKKVILINAINALGRLGIYNPKIAILAPNEKVHPKMQSTVDARRLVEMRNSGEIPSGIVEGPVALDVAVSHEAAEHKEIDSEISGDVDLFLVHSLDVGNILGKSLMYYAHAKMAGLVVGAEYPIVLTSRAETPEGKLNSIALACLMMGNKA